MEFFDTHAHINFNAFKDDGDEVIRRSLDSGMWLVLPGSQIDTSRRAVEYAERWDNPRVWAAVGLHPIHLEEMELDESEEESLVKFKTRKEVFDHSAYLLLAKNRKTVAIGEIGLDWWHKPKSAFRRQEFEARQRNALLSQLDLAVKVGKPVILHCRLAHDELLELVRGHRITQEVSPPGIIHSYTGSIEQARAFIELGYYIGFNGIIFKLNLDDVIRFVPLERIVLETDSPYLAPPQVYKTDPSTSSGQDRRNEPLNVRYVAEKIAELKGLSVEEVAQVTTKNARTVFRV